MHSSRPQPHGRFPRHLGALLLLVAGCAGLASGALGQQADRGTEGRADDATRGTQDLLVFLGAKYAEFDGLDSTAFEDRETTPTADLFYSRSAERFRLLGEFLLTDDEHELERFQAGWQLSETTRLWLGRFHQSASHWNTEHHHGQFLQTSITRPAIEEFEDDSGPLPSHSTGLLLERQQQVGAKSGLDLSVSAGLTSTLAPQELEPFDLLDPEGGHGNGLSVRIGFLPDFLGDNAFGFAYGKHTIYVAAGTQLPAAWSPDVDRIDLSVAGLYADWAWPKWQLTAAVNRVETEPGGATEGPHSDFVASYAQGEYQFNPNWIVYGRVEDTSGIETYLEIFPAYIRRQALVGGRRLIGKRNAVTVDLASAERAGDRFHRVAVQWSAVFP